MEHHNSHNGVINAMLFILTGFLKALSELSFGDVLSYTFNILSIFSVILIIIINWEKAMNVLFKKKKE